MSTQEHMGIKGIAVMRVMHVQDILYYGAFVYQGNDTGFEKL